MSTHSDFVFALRPLGLFQKPGTWVSVAETVPAPAGLAIEVIGVPAGSDLVLDLQLESVAEGIYVSGTVQVKAVGEDIRTLDPLELDIAVDLNELFVYHANKENEEEDLYEIDGDRLDLEPAVRDAVVMALPFRPTVSDDDTDFSFTLGEDIDEEEAEGPDPRWSALQNLLDDKKES